MHLNQKCAQRNNCALPLLAALVLLSPTPSLQLSSPASLSLYSRIVFVCVCMWAPWVFVLCCQTDSLSVWRWRRKFYRIARRGDPSHSRIIVSSVLCPQKKNAFRVCLSCSVLSVCFCGVHQRPRNEDAKSHSSVCCWLLPLFACRLTFYFAPLARALAFR